MAERKSGPVKPPVIDLTAKPATRRSAAPERAAAGEPAAKASKADTKPDPKPLEPPAVATDPGADSVADTPRPPPPPRPQARLAMPWSAISIAAVAGAILGTILTYLAVSFIALPEQGPAIADPAPRLAAQEAAIADLTARLAAAEQAAQATQASAETAASGLRSDLDVLQRQVAAIPAPATVDLTPLEQQVAGIEDRIDAIGAGASGADATALAQTIAGLESGLGEVRETLGALTQRTTAAEQSLASLRGELDATKSAVAAQTSMIGSSDIGPAVRLPLIVSGIESAFANGRPYSAELSGLVTLLPDLAVPEPISAAAPVGLPRPDAVATAFTERVPDILAGRAAQGSGDLTQDAIDWAKGLLALRPVDETEGSTPEAIVSRLEAAVARRDFVGAAALLDQLPAPMQAGAGATAIQIRTLAAADGFIAMLRARALEQPAPQPAAPAPRPGEQPQGSQATEATP
jgi:hypothetical protein